MNKLITRGIIEITLTIVFILALFYLTPLHTIFQNEASLKAEVASFGVWGPLGIIIFKIIEVIVWFIPGAIPTAVSGYFFGPYYGTLLVLAGETLGAIVLFLAARSFGKRIVFKYIDRQHHEKFDKFFRKKGIYAFALFKMVPVLPKDVLTIVAGLSRMRLKQFIILNIIFSFPSAFIVAVLGDQLAQFRLMPIIWAVLVIVASALFLFKFHPRRAYK